MRTIAFASKARLPGWRLGHDESHARRRRLRKRAPGMITLRDAILELIADLRSAEVRISVAESLDAMRAMAAIGIERGPLREALAAALIKEEADRAIFDETFSRRFGSARPAYADAHRNRGERTGLQGASGGPSESSMPDAARAQPDDEAPAGLAPTPKPSPARDKPERITP